MSVVQKNNESVEDAARRAIEQTNHIDKDESVTLTVIINIEVWPDEDLADVMLRIIDRVRG